MGKAVLTIVAGPNQGDTVSIDWGVCRLLGRHLSESETALIDRDGNRILDGQSAQLIGDHLQDRAPAMSSTNRAKPSPTASVFLTWEAPMEATSTVSRLVQAHSAMATC